MRTIKLLCQVHIFSHIFCLLSLKAWKEKDFMSGKKSRKTGHWLLTWIYFWHIFWIKKHEKIWCKEREGHLPGMIIILTFWGHFKKLQVNGSNSGADVFCENFKSFFTLNSSRSARLPWGQCRACTVTFIPQYVSVSHAPVWPRTASCSLLPLCLVFYIVKTWIRSQLWGNRVVWWNFCKSKALASMKAAERASPGSESSWWPGSHPASILQRPGCAHPGLMKRRADESGKTLQGEKISVWDAFFPPFHLFFMWSSAFRFNS